MRRCVRTSKAIADALEFPVFDVWLTPIRFRLEIYPNGFPTEGNEIAGTRGEDGEGGHGGAMG